MAYTETTTSGYGNRLSSSLKGIVTGFVLFVIGTALLFWNEGNYINTYKAIKEAESVVVPVENVSTVDPSLNGKLIHASALATTTDKLRDDLFGVEVNAVKLKRQVEYYQWWEESKTETRDKIGGGEETITTYTYKKDWDNEPIDSAKFHDPEYRSSNFVLATVDKNEQIADNVTFGAYTLPDFLKDGISGKKAVEANLTESQIKQWEAVLVQNRPQLKSLLEKQVPTVPAVPVAVPSAEVTTPAETKPAETTPTVIPPAENKPAETAPAVPPAATPAPVEKPVSENKAETEPVVPTAVAPTAAPVATVVTENKTPDKVTPYSSPIVHVNQNVVYFGENSGTPQVGDVKITLTRVDPANVSIIAKVNGSTFETYHAKSGKNFSSFSMGTVSADEMFASEHQSNTFFTWLLRILGTILIISALNSMFSIIPSLFKVLPFLGNIAEAGVGLVCAVGGFAWSVFVIAVAWFFYRPIIGAALLVLVIAAIWYLGKAAKDKTAKAN